MELAKSRHLPLSASICLGTAVAAVALAAWPVSVEAAPSVRPLSVHVVGRSAPEQPFTDRPTEARLADSPELSVVVIARRGKRRGKRVYIVDDSLGEVRVRGRRVRKSERLSWEALGEVEVRWSLVEPHAWREEGEVAKNGTDTRFHSNVSLKSESYGKWLGYDEIHYFETVVRKWAKGAQARRIAAAARPPRPEADIYDGLGTMRYKVEVKLADGRILASPGADAVDRYGILPSVHRVSLRSDDTFLGYLTSYFMVPEVFGSAGSGRHHQTERFTGADCADVLVGAVRRQGFRNAWYTNVAGLGRYTRTVASAFNADADGVPDREITGIRVGDLIRIDYGGALSGSTPRSWDHVAAVYEDRSDPDGPHGGAADGKLDGFDLIVHMGHPRLVVEPLSEQTPAKLDVLRWSPRKLRRRSK